MPFSSRRSVRAPASNATSTVVARVPGSSMRWIGSPEGIVDVSMRAIPLCLHDRFCNVTVREGRAAGGRNTLFEPMAATERHARDRRARPRRRRGRAVIDFEDVSKRYPSGDTGLENVSFSVQPGEFVFIVGASGSGKSTTMRLLIKEVEPTGGTIQVAGHDLSKIRAARCRTTAATSASSSRTTSCCRTGRCTRTSPTRSRSRAARGATIREKVPDILRLTGLSLKLHTHPDQLSGGEQQRVSVARAFVNHPPLLLADEPTGNLDPETSIGIMQLLYRINRTGTTVVVATHDVDMVDRMRRRVIELSDGRVVRDERAGAYAARETTGEFAVAPARGRQREARLLPPRGAARAAPQRGPLVRGDGHRARHGADPRRLHPDRAGHDRGGQRGPRPRDRRRLPQDGRRRPRRRSRAQPARDPGPVRRPGRVSSPRSRPTASERKRNPEAYDLLGANPLPDTFRVTPDRPDNIAKLRDALTPVSPAGGRAPVDEAIDDVRNREDDTNKILSVTRVVKLTMALLAALLVIASVLLIANTIRLSLYARRREVEVMKLVGATDWFIRWPFVIEGVLVGALGGIVAVLLLAVVKVARRRPAGAGASS